MHLLLASASFPTRNQHTKLAVQIQPNLVEFLGGNFNESRTLCGQARSTCMPRLRAAAPHSAAMDTERPTCMPTACCCAPFGGMNTGRSAPHLHAACVPPACRLRADCLPLHPVRRRWTQHATCTPTACRCTPFGGGGHSALRLRRVRRPWTQRAPPACTKFGYILGGNFGGPGHFLDPACALLADVVQVSSQKSAFKARTKVHLNLVDFSAAVWADPGCFFGPGLCTSC